MSSSGDVRHMGRVCIPAGEEVARVSSSGSGRYGMRAYGPGPW